MGFLAYLKVGFITEIFDDPKKNASLKLFSYGHLCFGDQSLFWTKTSRRFFAMTPPILLKIDIEIFCGKNEAAMDSASFHKNANFCKNRKLSGALSRERRRNFRRIIHDA